MESRDTRHLYVRIPCVRDLNEDGDTVTVVYGCIEGVFSSGDICGWARFGDPAVRPSLVAFLNGMEVARGSCELQRDELGGRFGFCVPCADRMSSLDLITGRLVILVYQDNDAVGLPIRMTEAASQMCRDLASASLESMNDDIFECLLTLIRKEAARREAVRASIVAEPGWHELKILRLEDVKYQSNVTILDEEVEHWARPGAAFVLDLSDGTFSTSVDHFRSYLLGPSSRDLRGIYETVWEDRYVYGSHHFYPFIGTDHTIQFQGLDDAAFRLDYHVDHQNVHAAYRVPLIDRSSDGFRINYDAMSTENTVELAGDVYFGSPIEPTNWGMWLIQGLQSAWRFKAGGQKGLYLCYASERFQRMLLSAVGIDDDKVIDMAQWRVYRCERLQALQYSHDTSLSIRPSDHEVLDYLVRKAGHTAPIAKPARAIFISRRNITASKAGTYRPLLNESSLLAEMERIGLAIVEPELLPFDQQVSLFRHAELVVGLGGAGLFNTVFCRPGTRVVTIESSTAFVDNHATLFGSLGLEYGVIFGKRDLTDSANLHYRWTVHIDAVSAQIQKLL